MSGNGWRSLLAVALLAFPPSALASDRGEAAVECTMTFALKGWSAFYRTADGSGEVRCDNGQRAAVRIRVRGGGLTFGKSEILEGTGNFSDVRGIDEVYGSYAAAEAHAGAVRSASAAVYTRGEVSLALAGVGRGVDVGLAFAKVTITPAR